MSEPTPPAAQEEQKAQKTEPVLVNENKDKPGPESLLTDELTLKIRALVLEGKKYTEIQQTLGIKACTWDQWVWKNYKDFRTNLDNWVHERIVKKARRNLEEFIDLPVEVQQFKQNPNYDPDGEEGEADDEPYIQVIKTDPALVRIKQDSSKFALERLDKENFAQRSEFTGKGGKDLHPEPTDEEKAKLNKLLEPNEPNEKTTEPEGIAGSNQRDATGEEVPVR